MGETMQFPGNVNKPEAKDEGAALPPILNLMVGEEDKVCPLMGAQMHTLPVISPASSVLVPQGTQQRIAFVRVFNPCVKDKCALWNEEFGSCAKA